MGCDLASISKNMKNSHCYDVVIVSYKISTNFDQWNSMIQSSVWVITKNIAH